MSRRWLLTLLLFLCGFFGSAAPADTTTLPTFDRVRLLETARPIEDRELIDQDGRPFRLSQLHGQVALVLFGFTHCPDVCPLAMEKFRQLADSAGPELDEVRLARQHIGAVAFLVSRVAAPHTGNILNRLNLFFRAKDPARFGYSLTIRIFSALAFSCSMLDTA